MNKAAGFLLLVLGLVVAAGTLQSACVFRSSALGPTTVTFENGTIRLDGTILASVAEEVRRVAPNAHTLEVRSRGGDELAAIEIGEIVQSSSIAVRVRDYCLSSCAQYIVPAANRRIALAGSLIGCHWNSLGIALSPAVLAPQPLSQVEQQILTRGAELYRRAGVNISYAYNCYQHVDPTCVRQDVSDGDRTRRILYTKTLWIPHASAFSAFGIGFEEGVPNSNITQARLSELHIPAGDVSREQPYPDDIILRLQSTLSRCPPFN